MTMNHVLIFLAGAVFGLGSTFVGVALTMHASNDEQTVMVCPEAAEQPLIAAAPAPAASCPEPAIAAAVTGSNAPVIAAEAVAVPEQKLETPQPPAPAPGVLLIPVAEVSANQLVDTFDDARGNGRVHDAIDIMAPTGTPVLAAADGRIVKLFTSVPGGLTVYQFDSSERFAYYYAHLDAYAAGLAEGQILKRGARIGTVGYSGNANAAAPHLHFAIFVLGPEKHWWQGTAINPYLYLRPELTAR